MRRFAAGIAAAAFMAAASVATGSMFAALFANRAAPAAAPAAAPLTIVFSGATPAQGSTQSSTSATVQCTSAYTGGEHSVAMNFDGSLVSWWRGENNATDSIGSNNGTWSGTPAYSSGKYGQAMSFSSSKVNAGTNGSLALTTWTISAWVNTPTLAVYPFVVGRANTNLSYAAGVNYYLQLYANGAVEAGFFDGSWRYVVTSAGRVTTGAWHNVQSSFDGIYIKTYVNGTLVVTSASLAGYTPPTNTNMSFIIAQTPYLGATSFTGSIDDVQIYNRSLSSNEVVSIYNAQVAQYSRTFTGLTNGVHTLRAYAQTTSGSITNTGLRTFTVAP